MPRFGWRIYGSSATEWNIWMAVHTRNGHAVYASTELLSFFFSTLSLSLVYLSKQAAGFFAVVVVVVVLKSFFLIKRWMKWNSLQVKKLCKKDNGSVYSIYETHFQVFEGRMSQPNKKNNKHSVPSIFGTRLCWNNGNRFKLKIINSCKFQPFPTAIIKINQTYLSTLTKILEVIRSARCEMLHIFFFFLFFFLFWNNNVFHIFRYFRIGAWTWKTENVALILSATVISHNSAYSSVTPRAGWF